MTDTELEGVLHHVALPPLRLGVRVRRLEARRVDPVARPHAEQELRLAELIRTRLVQGGMVQLTARRVLLRVALGFLSLKSGERELRLLNCFDTWWGIGDIVAGMARQDYDLELRRYDYGQGGARCSFRAALSTRSRHMPAAHGR